MLNRLVDFFCALLCSSMDATGPYGMAMLLLDAGSAASLPAVKNFICDCCVVVLQADSVKP